MNIVRLSNQSGTRQSISATDGVAGRHVFTKNAGVFFERVKDGKKQVDSHLAAMDFRF